MKTYFVDCTSLKLKAYLQGCGLTVAVYRKNLLCELAITVRHCKLPVDPNKIPVRLPAMLRVVQSLQKMRGSEQIFEWLELHTMTLDCVTSSLFYSLFSRADYDRRKLRAYNSWRLGQACRPTVWSTMATARRHVIPWNLIAVVTGDNELILSVPRAELWSHDTSPHDHSSWLREWTAFSVPPTLTPGGRSERPESLNSSRGSDWAVFYVPANTV